MADNKKIGTLVAMAVGLGAIIGAGIFVLSGTAVALAGANALIAFILVGIVALIMAFEFGELGSIFPHVKGAAYSYVYNAFGSELGFITGLIKYFSYATAISVISLGFGSYFTSLFGITIAGGSILFAILLIIVLSVLNLLGLKKAAKTDSFLVIIKMAALLVFIGFAVFFVVHSGGIKVSNFSVSPSQGALAALFAASIVIFFAYSGFQTIVTLTPEIKGGGRAAAKATIYAVVISIALYVAVVAALLLLVPASHFTVSGDPLALALQQSSSPQWLLIVVDVGALVATASAALAMLIASSRMLYQVGVDRLLPKFFRGYNGKRDVPTQAVAISAIIAMVMLFSGNIFIMTAISNFGMLFAYLMTSFAVIHFRRRKVFGDFKMPLYPYLPVVGIIAILLFMIGMPQESLVIGVIMIFSLIILYYFFSEEKDKRVVKIKLFR
jgi:APA family basic amino acid/polyamine antiporter